MVASRTMAMWVSRNGYLTHLFCALGETLVEDRVIPELSENRVGDTASREDIHTCRGIRT